MLQKGGLKMLTKSELKAKVEKTPTYALLAEHDYRKLGYRGYFHADLPTDMIVAELKRRAALIKK